MRNYPLAKSEEQDEYTMPTSCRLERIHTQEIQQYSTDDQSARMPAEKKNPVGKAISVCKEF